MGDRVAVERARIDAADQVCAGRIAASRRSRGPGVAHDPGLRERHHLDPARPAWAAAARARPRAVPVRSRCRPGHGCAPASPRRRSCAAERACRPLGDGLAGVASSPVVLDQAGEPGTGRVRTERQAEPGRVEVGVGVERTPGAARRRRRRPPARPSGAASAVLDGRDPAFPDEDVGGRATDGPAARAARCATAGRRAPSPTLRVPSGSVPPAVGGRIG